MSSPLPVENGIDFSNGGDGGDSTTRLLYGNSATLWLVVAHQGGQASPQVANRSSLVRPAGGRVPCWNGAN